MAGVSVRYKHKHHTHANKDKVLNQLYLLSNQSHIYVIYLFLSVSL